MEPEHKIDFVGVVKTVCQRHPWEPCAQRFLELQESPVFSPLCVRRADAWVTEKRGSMFPPQEVICGACGKVFDLDSASFVYPLPEVIGRLPLAVPFCS